MFVCVFLYKNMMLWICLCIAYICFYLVCLRVYMATIQYMKMFSNLYLSWLCFSGLSFLHISSPNIFCAAVTRPWAIPILLIAHNCLVDIYFLISSNITGGLVIKHTWGEEWRGHGGSLRAWSDKRQKVQTRGEVDVEGIRQGRKCKGGRTVRFLSSWLTVSLRVKLSQCGKNDMSSIL